TTFISFILLRDTASDVGCTGRGFGAAQDWRASMLGLIRGPGPRAVESGPSHVSGARKSSEDERVDAYAVVRGRLRAPCPGLRRSGHGVAQFNARTRALSGAPREGNDG